MAEREGLMYHPNSKDRGMGCLKLDLARKVVLHCQSIAGWSRLHK